MDELSYYPGLVRRGDVFYYRRRVPQDIAGSFGKQKVCVSLQTFDRPVASNVRENTLCGLMSSSIRTGIV